MSSQLLPVSATPQELALEQATARVSDVQVLVRESWNPDTCPVSLLPWLAWAYSVDDWNPAWTEAQKRAAIRASVYVHQHKGTVGAVKRALDAFGFEVEPVEWFRKTPIGDPYTFGLQVTVDQVGLPTDAVYQEVIAVAETAKNLRSHLTGVDVLAVTSGTMCLGGACWLGETVRLDGEPETIVFNETTISG